VKLKGKCPLCSYEKTVSYNLINCSEMQRWTEDFLKSKWLSINEVSYKKLKGCTKLSEMRQLGKIPIC
jgi:hypothetical protein